MRTITLCCTIVVLVIIVVLWIRKSRQTAKGNDSSEVVTQKKRIFKFYSCAVGCLVCYGILILLFDGSAVGAAFVVVPEILLLRKAITI